MQNQIGSVISEADCQNHQGAGSRKRYVSPVSKKKKSWLAEIGHGVISLVKGMGVTFGYISSPDRIITQQYPENRQTLTMFPRFRGRLSLLIDEQNCHYCTGCGICEKSCPNGSISVLTVKNDAGKKELVQYIYRLNQCTLCNLCVEACPAGAIYMSQEFELATYDRQQLTLNLNQVEQ